MLTNEVARGRDQAHVTFFFEDRVDRHAQHDLGLARTRRRFEQELEDVIVEPGADRIDRRALIGRERERLAGLNEFVCDGNRLRVAVDRRPNLGI
jgi:hypothetical protein